MPYGIRQETGRPVSIKDEGLTLVSNVKSVDFTGDGVAGSAIGSDVTEEITGGGGVWGTITGTLSDQTDLQAELDKIVTDHRANTALSNLASVAINTSLLFDTDSTYDIGDSSNYIANTYTDKIYLSANNTIYLEGNSLIVKSGTSSDYVKVDVDNHRVEFGSAITNVYPSGSATLGKSSNYWTDIFSTDVYLNSTAVLDGATAGEVGVTGNVVLGDDQYLYLDTAKSVGMKYGSGHGDLVMPSEFSSIADFAIYTNTAADAAGNWEPSIQIGANGRINIDNTTQGNAADRKLVINMTSGLEIAVGDIYMSYGDIKMGGHDITAVASIIGKTATTSLILAGATYNAQRDVVVSTVNAAGDAQVTRLTFGSDADDSTATFSNCDLVLNTGGGKEAIIKADNVATSDKTFQFPNLSGTLVTSAGIGANIDIGAYTITGTQFISDIAIGTAPFVVTSTTEVANLRAATASNLSGTPALPNGTTATTQAAADNSTKLATTAYADTAAAGGGATAALDNLASVAINAALVLGTSDAFALGSATKMWSDLFLASGSVVNFNNGDVTITHSLNTLTVAGGTIASTLTGNVTGDCSGSSGSCTGNSDTVTTNANLTGIVTSVGNATAIANKAIAIAKLADGTDGQLITWDAAGVIATVAVGTATQVLTSNGVGAAPTFQDAAGGGASTALDNLAAVQINVSLVSDTDITDSLGTGDVRWKDAWFQTLSAGLTAADTLKLRGRDVDGSTYIDILTITSNNTVTADLNALVTIGGNAILDDTSTASALTSVGTLTALQVDNININLNTISSTAGTDLLITPLANQQIVLDNTIIIDAGVVTGATSITSTAFVGDVTGDVTGNADTVTNATFTTALTVDTGTLTLTAAGANNSVLTIGAGASSISGANTGDQDLSGKADVAQTMHIGTTSVAINRASAALTLAGITLTTPDIGTPSAGTLTNCSFPTLNQSTTGSAATLTTGRTIGGVSFNGSTNIVPNTITIADESVDATCFVGFFTAATGGLQPKTGTNLTFDSSTGILTATGFTGDVTGNCTGSSGTCTGEAATVATITTLAPDTATTQATQASITTCVALTTVGALNAGSITSGFTSIDVGAGAITTTGDITGGGIHATGDTTAGDNAALGYTATEGLIMTGQGSTNDLTFKNDADAEVMKVLTGTTTLTMAGAIQLGETSIKLDAVLSADAKWSGITIAGVSGVTTLAIGDLIYLNANDSRWELVDANLSDGYDKRLGIALTAAADGATLEVLVYGKVRSAAFPAFTVGSPLYISETAGDITHTAPTTTDAAVRIIGDALTATDLFFNPSNDYYTHT